MNLPVTGPRWLNQITGYLAALTALTIPLSTTLTGILFYLIPVLVLCTTSTRPLLSLLWTTPATRINLLAFLGMLLALTYTTAAWPEAIHGLMKYDKLLLGVFFLPIFADPRWRDWAIRGFLAALTLIWLAGAIRYFTGAPLGHPEYGPMLFFKDRIQTSFTMAIGAYITAVLCLEDTRSTRWIYGCYAILCSIALFAIEGRSGYVVFVVLMTWLGWRFLPGKLRLLAIFIPILILLGATLASPIFQYRMQEALDNLREYAHGQHISSVGLRVGYLTNAIPLIAQHPVLGTGTGSFSQTYAAAPGVRTDNPHNQYIHIAIQWGILGVCVFLIMLLIHWRNSRTCPAPWQRMLEGMVLAMAVGSCANSWLLDTMEGHAYVFFLALCLGSSLRTNPSLESSRVSC